MAQPLPELDEQDLLERTELDLARGRKMQELLDSPVVYEFFDGYRESLFEVIESSTTGQTSARESAYHRLAALRELRQQLQRVVDTGKFAAVTLNEANDGES